MRHGGCRVVEDRVRVVIAEDSVLLREGLTRLLTDRGHDVVAGVGDAEALIKTIGELAAQGALPDVVVADVRMPPTHTDEGVRAAVQLRKEHPGTRGAGAVAVRGGAVRHRAAGRLQPRRGLSAQGPGGRGAGVRGRGGAGGPGRYRAGPGGRRAAARAAAASRTCWPGSPRASGRCWA